MEGVTVERIIIVNAPKALESVTEVKVTEGGKSTNAQVSYHAAQDGNASWLVVRSPAVKIGSDWNIELPSGVGGGAKSEL